MSAAAMLEERRLTIITELIHDCGCHLAAWPPDMTRSLVIIAVGITCGIVTLGLPPLRAPDKD